MKRFIVAALLLMVTASLSAAQLQTLNPRAGLPNFFAAAQKGDSIRIVYFGGSITNHNGYRVYTHKWLQERFPKATMTAFNAGVGGTGSDLGVFRMDDDVIARKPDLVFVEFAVNDSGTDSLAICHSMEGIVRKIRSQMPQTEICFLYTVSNVMLPELTKGKMFRSMRIMERIADHYKIPSVNFSADVVELLKKDSLIFKGDKSRPEGKITFTEDGVHPTIDQGHKLYAKSFATAVEQMQKQGGRPMSYKLSKPLYAGNFEKAKSVALSSVKVSGNWRAVKSDDPIYKYYQGSSVRFPDLIVSDDPQASIEIKFNGTVAGIFDVVGPATGNLSYSIDSAEPVVVRRFDVYCGNVFRSFYKLFPVLKSGEHTIVIRPVNTPFDKRAIYGSRPSRIDGSADSDMFDQYATYAGKVLLIGDIVQ